MDHSNNKTSVSERRASYPLQQRLRIYGPETMARRIDQTKRRKSALTVRGVNILNKSDLETDVVLDRIRQRKETHNRVERRRRDMLVS